MAWMRDLESECQQFGCSRMAKVEVLSPQNHSFGYFCRPCGRGKLKQLNDYEEKEAERRLARGSTESPGS